MKKALFILAITGFLFGCKNEIQQKEAESQPEEVAINYENFGENISNDSVLTKEEMIEKFHTMRPGDTLHLKFTSEVKEVCQKKGCWMKLDLDQDMAMVRFKDYGFFMPKDIAGREVIVAGKAYVEEMSVEDQKHYAEDGGKSEEEIALITQPKITYAFEADGVLIPKVEKQ